MCTAIRYRGLAGRTLDLEHSFAEEVVITPRNYMRKFVFEGEILSKYALVGMAYVHLGVPLYYDAVSEAGLYMAALNFPNCARYHEARAGAINLASAELIPYILENSGSLAEAKEVLKRVNITPHSISESLPSTPLHWFLADGRESLSIEPTEKGLEITENPFGVLTNAPNFTYHTTRLADFLHLSTTQPENKKENWQGVSPYSRGMGALGLPGDYSSTSRFVRAAFLAENVRIFDSNSPQSREKHEKFGIEAPQLLKRILSSLHDIVLLQKDAEKETDISNLSSKCSPHLSMKNGDNADNNFTSEQKYSENSRKNSTNKEITAFFHVTDSLTVPYGTVLTDEGRAVYTVYTSCADLMGGVYYFTTYNCRTPHAVTLTEDRKAASQIIRFPLPSGEKIVIE